MFKRDRTQLRSVVNMAAANLSALYKVISYGGNAFTLEIPGPQLPHSTLHGDQSARALAGVRTVH